MASKFWTIAFLASCLLFSATVIRSEDEIEDEYDVRVEEDIGKAADASRTDDQVVEREQESIHIDGLSPNEIKILREQSEKHIFHAEVNRMMKLIINSLYRNKEIFLREIISNASDALDKIRIISLTNESALDTGTELSIKVKVDVENQILHITDTGIGMTKEDLVRNLGTIAKSGTSDFFENMSNASSEESVSDLIGQFGVGFYSAFLVAEKVVVTSKHNDDSQHIWESDAESFSVVSDPRGNTLGRGTTVSLYMKEEASDFLQQKTIKALIQKYSQFINFPIYLWSEKTVTEEVPLEDEREEKDVLEEGQPVDDNLEEDEAEVEEEAEEEKPKTRTITKTIWDWELMNETKPIWQRPIKEVDDDEYDAFYKAIAKESKEPMARTHFSAEGEISFKSILYIPSSAPLGMMHNYGHKRSDNIKMYVRRVFITDDFHEMMPKYLQFIRGVVDSDDLPLNVSRETLQQHKLLKVIKKKLVRKALDMIKKLDPEVFIKKFWKEFGTNMKLGIIEDQSNRTRLSKLVRFPTSKEPKGLVGFADYVKRMKEGQEMIYYCSGTSLAEVENSPFVERLRKKDYEVVYLTESVDEYMIQALPEYDGKRFQNVAKEGLGLDDSKKAKAIKEALQEEFKPLADWLKETAFKDRIEKALITERLAESPCALVASQFGWSGNMERIMKAQAYKVQKDTETEYFSKQKKVLEINPRHPLIKKLLEIIVKDENDPTADQIAQVMFDTAVLRSGFTIQDSVTFSNRVLKMLYLNLDIDPDTPVDDEPDLDDDDENEEENEEIIADEDDETTTERKLDDFEDDENKPVEETEDNIVASRTEEHDEL